jgi:hypothetical protein
LAFQYNAVTTVVIAKLVLPGIFQIVSFPHAFIFNLSLPDKLQVILSSFGNLNGYVVKGYQNL